MNDQKLLIPTYYILQIAEELSAGGVDAELWLKNAFPALSSTYLDSPPSDLLTLDSLGKTNHKISLQQFKTLVTSAVELSNDAAIGLKVGKKLGLTSHGMLGYAIIASGTVREMVSIFSRYLNTRTPLLRVDILTSESTLKLKLHECYALDKIKVPFIESAIYTIYNLLMQITQNVAPIRKISFPYPKPTYWKAYSECFDYPIEFDQSAASISLNQREIDRPLLMSDKASLEQAKIICEQELVKLQTDESLEIRIRKYLLSFENTYPNLIEVAKYLNISKRTLHRRLENENTNYTNILKSVKSFRACELLANSQLTVQEIGFTVGYTDVANFRKAFKEWKGMSPKGFREQYFSQIVSNKK